MERSPFSWHGSQGNSFAGVCFRGGSKRRLLAVLPRQPADDVMEGEFVHPFKVERDVGEVCDHSGYSTVVQQ